LRVKGSIPARSAPGNAGYPCFVYRQDSRTELLWGATYRIVTTFLELVFGFHPPPFHMLPVVEKAVSPAYFNGRA
jgi:hypothetical protein